MVFFLTGCSQNTTVKDPRCEIERNPDDIREGEHFGAEYGKDLKQCKTTIWGCGNPPFTAMECEAGQDCLEKSLLECKQSCEVRP